MAKKKKVTTRYRQPYGQGVNHEQIPGNRRISPTHHYQRDGMMSGISGPKKDEIIQSQLSHFYKVDKQLAEAVAKGLNVNFKP